MNEVMVDGMPYIYTIERQGSQIEKVELFDQFEVTLGVLIINDMFESAYVVIDDESYSTSYYEAVNASPDDKARFIICNL